jgi:hypothetical protein
MFFNNFANICHFSERDEAAIDVTRLDDSSDEVGKFYFDAYGWRRSIKPHDGCERSDEL